MSKKLLMNNVFSNNEGIVKDNLILYLDAMNNTRDGQSSSITSWHDLSGNNYDLQGKFSVFNKYITLTDEGWIDIPKAIDMKRSTIEIRCKPMYKYTTLLGITHLYNRPFIQFPQYLDTTTMVLFGNDAGTFGDVGLSSDFNTYTFTFNNGNYVGYLNGVKKFSGKKTSTSIPYEWLYFKLHNGSYCSVRIYNEILSEDDILSNYNYDLGIYS